MELRRDDDRLAPAQRDRYLARLGCTAAPPSLAALTALVTAHLARFPFENVSKLVRARRGLPPGLPGIDELLEDNARHGTGGTCYLLNSSLHRLLASLGYDARLAGADMSQPDVHVVNVVVLDGRPFLVDVGYAAPFFAPMPLDAAEPLVIAHGADRYTLHPDDGRGRHRLHYRSGGGVDHGYTVHGGPRRIEEFAGAVADSFRPDAEFMNRFRAVRFAPARSASVRDLSAIVTEGTEERTVRLDGRAALLAFVEREIGIAREIAAEACDALVTRGHAALV